MYTITKNYMYDVKLFKNQILRHSSKLPQSRFLCLNLAPHLLDPLLVRTHLTFH